MGLSMPGDLCAAYAGRHDVQRGSGTAAVSPRSFSEAAVSWLLSAKVGTVWRVSGKGCHTWRKIKCELEQKSRRV